MCGRYTLSTPADLVGDFFEVDEPPELAPRYNIAPTQEAPIVRHDEGGRRIDLARWGLVPYWAKDRSIGNRMINARSETAADKPAYRSSFRRRRCVVPADGFFEWKKISPRGPKQPWYFRPSEDPLFGIAGLWDRWDRGDEPLESFTLLTTTPNPRVGEIHDRMPVILDPSDFDLWLDPAAGDLDALRSLLAPFPAERMAAWPVTTYVNNPSNEGPACIDPSDEPQPRLT